MGRSKSPDGPEIGRCSGTVRRPLGLVQLGGYGLTRVIATAGHTAGRVGEALLGVAWLLLVIAAALLLRLRLPGPRSVIPARALRWMLGGVAAMGLFAVMVLVLVVLPPRFTADRNFNNAVDELKAQSDIRTSLIQAFAGTVLVSGAYLTWLQLQMNRENQINDRFDKATGHLDAGALDVRIGGLHILESVAKKSESHRETIAKMLCAHVRIAPSLAPRAGEKGVFRPAERAGGDVLESSQETRTSRLTGCAEDVQEALTILGRWRERLGKPPEHLDLQGAILQRAKLVGMQLQRANLCRARLEYADLSDVQLEGADLSGAQLQHANLSNAQLEGADLSGAQLQHADLNGARLSHAKLVAAKLNQALLSPSELQEADLSSAQLRSAKLMTANLRKAILVGAQLQQAYLVRADLSGARMKDTQLQGSDLRGAQLQGSDLSGAQLQGSDLRSARLQDVGFSDEQVWITDLSGAQLEGADLSGVQYDSATRWPEGWDFDKEGH